MKIVTMSLLILLTFTCQTYAKCFEGDCENGIGTLYGSDGTVYVGQFKEGKFHGQGSCFFTDGSYYNGAWLDGRFHGKGMFISTEGKKQIGLFLGGKFIEPLPPSEVAEGLDTVTQLQEESALQAESTTPIPTKPASSVSSEVPEAEKASVLNELSNKRLKIGEKKPASEISPQDFPGDFPEASKRYLTTEDLKNRSLSELQLMRNEIFARHSYSFTNLKIKKYFKKLSWYSERSQDVFMELTEIEKANVKLISEYEKNIENNP